MDKPPAAEDTSSASLEEEVNGLEVDPIQISCSINSTVNFKTRQNPDELNARHALLTNSEDNTNPHHCESQCTDCINGLCRDQDGHCPSDAAGEEGQRLLNGVDVALPTNGHTYCESGDLPICDNEINKVLDLNKVCASDSTKTSQPNALTFDLGCARVGSIEDVSNSMHRENVSSQQEDLSGVHSVCQKSSPLTSERKCLTKREAFMLGVDITKESAPSEAGQAEEEELSPGTGCTERKASPGDIESPETVGAVDPAAVIVQPTPCSDLMAYCPAGLQDLLDVAQLVIHKQNLRKNIDISGSAAAKLEVVNISRQVVLHVEREAPPLTNKSFLYKLYNREKMEVMQVYCPQGSTCVCCGASWHWCSCCKLQAMVFAPPGHICGFIKREQSRFVQEYHILNAHEQLIFVLRGGPLDLEIYTPDFEDELGRIAVHNWVGIMREIKRSNEDYGITFPLDLDVQIKATLLGAVFLLDWIFTTKAGRRL